MQYLGGEKMKKVFNSIVTFFKNIFGKDIKVSVKKNQKYNINKNKQCNISINDGGDKNGKK